MHNPIKEIRELQKYSDNLSYKLIADFILKNYDKLDKYTIFDISKKTSTSPSTVTRFCKKIGLNGFKGLATLFNNNFQYRQQYENIIIDELDDGLNNLQKIYNVSLKSLEKSFALNKVNIQSAINAIKKADNIFIFSKGGNSQLSYLFTQWLIRVNKKTFYSSDQDFQKAYINIMQRNDLAFIISYSLENDYIVNIINNLNKNDLQKIIITKNINSSLINFDDIILEMGQNESTIQGRFFAEISTLFILKLIFTGIIDKETEELLKQTDVNY